MAILSGAVGSEIDEARIAIGNRSIEMETIRSTQG
jgi:hypothetical protein